MATRVKAIILFTPSSYTWYNTKPVYVCMILTHLDGKQSKVCSTGSRSLYL